MFGRSEQDLILASKEIVNNHSQMYQIYHKLAQCQVKLKKRRESIKSLHHARIWLSKAKMDKNNKMKFDAILKDSIQKISRRTEECKEKYEIAAEVNKDDHSKGKFKCLLLIFCKLNF